MQNYLYYFKKNLGAETSWNRVGCLIALNPGEFAACPCQLPVQRARKEGPFWLGLCTVVFVANLCGGYVSLQLIALPVAATVTVLSEP